MIPIIPASFAAWHERPGGIGKAEGFADGEGSNHRQAALAVATRKHTMDYEIVSHNRHGRFSETGGGETEGTCLTKGLDD
jgi:hypothetical protein